MTPVSPAPEIRHACVEGLWIVLDLGTESYFVLDEVASTMWEALLETGEPDAAGPVVATRWCEDSDLVSADLKRFAATCRERGWLIEGSGATIPTSGAPASGPGARSRHSVAVALASLAATVWSLRRSGFRKTYERYAELPCGHAAGELEETAATFRSAENVFLSGRAPNDCLMRSLALFRFLRTCGVPAEHVIGVRRVPFWAHAWVECGAEPVLEDPASVSGLTPLARLPSV